MRKMIAGSAAAAFLLVWAGSLLAHHSLAQFDTTKAVRVKGVIVRFEQVNPHTILFVDEKRGDGQIQRWAVEGPGILQLNRKGISKEAFKVGDVIEACGYVTKDGVESQRTVSTEPISSNLKAKAPKGMRLMDAEELVMPDGQKQVWSDYGHHKCLGPDYTDFHVK
jgi:hypothetical protein